MSPLGHGGIFLQKKLPPPPGSPRGVWQHRQMAQALVLFEGQKYTVYKADGTVVNDAVVIRLKDPFATTALYSYANTILSFVELMETTGHITKKEKRRLMDIADYFHTQAGESAKIRNKRLPD